MPSWRRWTDGRTLCTLERKGRIHCKTHAPNLYVCCCCSGGVAISSTSVLYKCCSSLTRQHTENNPKEDLWLHAFGILVLETFFSLSCCCLVARTNESLLFPLLFFLSFGSCRFSLWLWRVPGKTTSDVAALALPFNQSVSSAVLCHKLLLVFVFSFFFFLFLPFLESLLRNRKREREKKKEKSRREKARGTDVLHEGFGRRSPRVDQQLRRRLTSVFPNAMLWIRLLYWAPSFFFALLICPNGWRDFSVSFSFPQVILDRKKAAFLPHREPR